jgi:hypothetical protein
LQIVRLDRLARPHLLAAVEPAMVHRSTSRDSAVPLAGADARPRHALESGLPFGALLVHAPRELQLRTTPALCGRIAPSQVRRIVILSCQ